MRWTFPLQMLMLAGIAMLAAPGRSPALADEKPSAGSGGTIAGTVTGRPKRYMKRGVLVYLEKVKGKFPPPKKHAVLDQKDMKFIPHVLPILAGTTVDFLNSDSVAHNVFSPDGEKYNLGTWPKGKTRSYTFKKTGVYAQLCHVHPEMEGFVVVLQNRYFAMADADGKYKIGKVPPGTYTVVAWNERMAPKRGKVTVKAGKTVKLDFKLKRK